jgi:hypothetical protein
MKVPESPKLSPQEDAVAQRALRLLGDPDFSRVRRALSEKTVGQFLIAGLSIQVEPGLPCSAVTNFEGEGFCLGADVQGSEDELRKTLLHEVYRLELGTLARDAAAYIDAKLAHAEAEQARDFAERAFALYFGASI